MKRSTPTAIAGLALIALLGVAPPAQAYLDPSTGSMILSAIVGLFATTALAVKTYWYKFKSLFRRDSNGERREDTAPDDGRRPADGDPSSD